MIVTHKAEAYQHLSRLCYYLEAIRTNPNPKDPEVRIGAMCYLEGRIKDLEQDLFGGQKENAAGQGDNSSEAFAINFDFSIPPHDSVDKEVVVHA